MTKYPTHQLIKKHTLDIGTFYFYHHFIISEINEGVVMAVNNTKELYTLVKKYYNTKTPFFYIANRVNSYSFEPTGHYNFGKTFPNAKGFAVIIYNDISNRIAEFESSFISAPTAIFDNLEEAVIWGKKLIIND